jgi:hypothetical protein
VKTRCVAIVHLRWRMKTLEGVLSWLECCARHASRTCGILLQRRRLAGRPGRPKRGIAEPGAGRRHMPGDSGLHAGRQGRANRGAQDLRRSQELRRLVQVLLRHGDPCQSLQALRDTMKVSEGSTQGETFLVQGRGVPDITLLVYYRGQPA